MSSTSFSIRPARHSDLPFVQSCAVEAYEIYVERIGKTPAPMVADFASSLTRCHLDIIMDGGTPAGYAVTYPRDDHLFVENIALLSKHQGKGMARQLFKHFENRAIQENHCGIELYTNEKMTENLSLYPHLGFKEIERKTEDGFKRVYFRKDLINPK